MQFKVRAAWGPYGASVELASYANTQPLCINSGGFFLERAREQLEWYIYGMHLLVGGGWVGGWMCALHRTTN